MFTASAIESFVKEGTVNVAVRFGNQSQKFDEWFSTKDTSDREWLKRIVKRRLDSLNSLDLTTVPLGPIDTSLIPSVPPDAKAVWLAKREKLRTYQEANKMMITSESDKAYIDLLADVKKTFKPEYLNL